MERDPVFIKHLILSKDNKIFTNRLYDKYKDNVKDINVINKVETLQKVELLDIPDLLEITKINESLLDKDKFIEKLNVDEKIVFDEKLNVDKKIIVNEKPINNIPVNNKVNNKKTNSVESDKLSKLYVKQTNILSIKTSIIMFIKTIIDYLLSILIRNKVLNNEEIKCITNIFSRLNLVNTIYLVLCYIIESIVNYVYSKSIDDNNRLNSTLDSDILFENKNINELDCFPLLANDEKIINGTLESFIEFKSTEALIQPKCNNLRDKAINLLNGSNVDIFDYEQKVSLTENSTNEDINKLILEFTLEVDKVICQIINKKKLLGQIIDIFNISVNLRFTISYLAGSAIYRIIKSTFYLINELNISKFDVSIIIVAIHNIYNNNIDVNSELLFKKLLNYIKFSEIKTC